MESFSFLLAPISVGVVLVGALVAVLLVRRWPRRAEVSPEERDEMARAPMSPSQKAAWCGLIIGIATLLTITVILADKGAAEYWENDDLRTLVVAIFIGGVIAHPLVPLLFRLGAVQSGFGDERERSIESRGPLVQPPAILLTLAAWTVTLMFRFREAGAVPMVYLYLMFGSVILVMMITHSFGILLGHWIGQRYGKS